MLFIKSKDKNQQETFAYYQHDQLGTPIQAIDKAGKVVWAADYNAFGQATITANDITSNLRLPGQYFDAETALHYNWNRYYNPEMGRYITSDPIGLAGGMNRYAYVLGNPISFYDPRGLDVTFIVNDNNFVIGSHTGLYVDSGTVKGRVLYDPGGSYRQNYKGSGDALYDKDADLNAFIKFQKEDGPDVRVFTFKTTKAEDDEIRENIENNGGCDPFFCTRCSTEVTDGIGPFKDLGIYTVPSSLARRLHEMQHPKKTDVKKYLFVI